jgi:hypothetical protein
VNLEIVYLIFFRVHQECAAVSAGVINRVIAGLEHGRGTDHRSSCWRLNSLEWNDTVFTHHSPLCMGGNATALGHGRPQILRPMMFALYDVGTRYGVSKDTLTPM